MTAMANQRFFTARIFTTISRKFDLTVTILFHYGTMVGRLKQERRQWQ